MMKIYGSLFDKYILLDCSFVVQKYIAWASKLPVAKKVKLNDQRSMNSPERYCAR